MIRKIANTHLMEIIYWIMCFLNFAIILFTGSMMYITITLVCRMQEASTFLASLSSVPENPMRILVISITSFFALLALMWARHTYRWDSWKLGLSFVAEVFLALIIMKELSFSTNSIVIFLIADFMSYLNTNRHRIIILAVLIMIYLWANYDLLSMRMPIVSFYDYIMCYSAAFHGLLVNIQNTMLSLNLILFIIYMVILVQEKANESKRFLQLNEELQELNEQLKEYAEIKEKMGETRERNRLAREIHDTLGHTLTGLSVGIDACVLTCEIDPNMTKKQLTVLAQTARQGLNDVRRSVDKLRVDALERLSLKDALNQMIQSFTNVTDVKINFVCHLKELKFNADEEDVIYRIVQEGLTNALRHGHASEVFISIAKEKKTLILMIEDNGVGCKDIQTGFGLRHMQERIALLQGSIRFYGLDGFVIIAEIPIREDL